MNWDQVEGKWKDMKGRFRSQWGKLSDDDIESAKGDRQRLEGKLQERYGVRKEEAKRWVDDFLDKL